MTKLPMGELEAQVMDLLWDGDSWMTAGDVHVALSEHRKIAYTTVMTILVRLWNKDRVDRRLDGRAFAYHPVKTREAYAAERMSEILATGGDRNMALAQFIDALPPRERSRVRQYLERRSRR